MKRCLFGLNLALLMVAGLYAKQEVTPQGQIGVVEQVDVVEAVPRLPLSFEPAEVKRMAIEAVDNLNKFFVLPDEVRNGLVAVAQHSDLITESVKIGWNQIFPMLKDMAMDLGPQAREVFRLAQPLIKGNFDGAARIGDQLIIKAGEIFEIIFNYQPRLMTILGNLKDSPEAEKWKLLLANYAAENGFGGTINMVNINYVLGEFLVALQNPEVMSTIANGIKELKTPGFMDRMEQEYAQEIAALKRFALDARAIIIDRTGKTPEQWLEEVKARGQEGIRALEVATGKTVDEMKALVQEKLAELGDVARQNVEKIRQQVTA